MADATAGQEVLGPCTECDRPVVYGGRGPRPEHCSPRCRTRAWRRGKGVATAVEIWDLVQSLPETDVVDALAALPDGVRLSVLRALQGLRSETRTGIS